LHFFAAGLGALHILILLFDACNVVQQRKVLPFAHIARFVSEPHDVHSDFPWSLFPKQNLLAQLHGQGQG
jgi:hypothetical protein